MVVAYVVWKVARKYRRYEASMERRERSDELPTLISLRGLFAPECTSPEFGSGTYQCRELTCPVHGERNQAMGGR